MNDVLVAKRTALEIQIDSEGSEASEIAKPNLAFDTIQSSGEFNIFFDMGLSGLDFITELGVGIKAQGTVSGLFADELDKIDDVNKIDDLFSEEQSSAQRNGMQALTDYKNAGFDLG